MGSCDSCGKGNDNRPKGEDDDKKKRKNYIINQIINQTKSFYKPINNGPIADIKNTSYINAVLNSLAVLKYVEIWIRNIFLKQGAIVSKELCFLYRTLYTGFKPDSTNFILHYYNELNKIYKLEKQEDPYHFLFYLLDILHSENNILNPGNGAHLLNYNIPINFKMDSSYMFDRFNNWFELSQNSIISNLFFNIMKNEHISRNREKVYFYSYKYIIKLDLDKIKAKKGKQNLTLDESLEYYPKIDKNNKSFICKSAKILVIALIRQHHSHICDLEFKEKMYLKNYPADPERSPEKYLYNLRTCISLNSLGDYFADLLINNLWFRFYKDEVVHVINIHENEPQILIYELDEPKINNTDKNNMNKNINDNINHNNNILKKSG